MWSYIPNHPIINTLQVPFSGTHAAETHTSTLSQPARYTFVSGSPSAVPSAKERNPSSCAALKFDKIDDVRRSYVGRSSKPLRMEMSNSVTGASMQVNGVYSEKCTRKTRLWDDFEWSTSASSLRTISSCDSISSLAMLCASESQTNTVKSRHRERGGETERAESTHITTRRIPTESQRCGPSTWTSH